MSDNQKIIKDLYTCIYALVSKLAAVEAKCDALEVTLCSVADKSGISMDVVRKLIADVTAQRHQEILERAENISPEFGARIDTRPPLPDMPDNI